jgi:hypothetical protein
MGRVLVGLKEYSMYDITTLTLPTASTLYTTLSRMDGSAPYREAVAHIGATTLGDVVRVQSALFARLSVEIPGWADADLAICDEVTEEMKRSTP